MKVHIHTKLCIICILTFAFRHCCHCHEEGHNRNSKESHSDNHNDYQISKAPYIPSGLTDRDKGRSAPAAEKEQKYYIEKLFEHYGDNGRLSFNGLENLLANLGLGEVKVVEINHEDIGHDHVSHLDVLDVQEGKHSHSHDHLHSHSNVENETVNFESPGKNISCDLQREKTESSLKLANEHNETGRHHKHHPPHEHNGTHLSHNNSFHFKERVDHSIKHLSETNTTQELHDRKRQKHKRRKDKNNSARTVDVEPQLGLDQNQSEPNLVPKENQVHARLHLSNLENASPGLQEHVPGNGNGQHHNHKREAPHNQMSVENHKIILESNQRNHVGDHQHEECLNVTQLLHYYGLNINSPISPHQFTYLCPALLYQIDRRLCIKHFRELQVEDLPKDKSSASAWVCGLISITVISLLSLVGVILIPIINQGCFKFLLSFLVALAVGTLSGDALLHLLPHSIGGGHDHGEDSSSQNPSIEHSHGDETEGESFLEIYDPVMKGLVALAGIYLLFIVEHCLRMFKHYKERKKNKIGTEWHVESCALPAQMKINTKTLAPLGNRNSLNLASECSSLQCNASLFHRSQSAQAVPTEDEDRELSGMEEAALAQKSSQWNRPILGSQSEQAKQMRLKKTLKVEDATIGRKLSDHKLNRRSDAEWLQLKPLAGADDSIGTDGQHNESELTAVEGQKEYLSKSYVSVEEEESMHHNQKEGSSHSDRDYEFQGGDHDHSHGNSTMTNNYKPHKHKHSHHSHGHCHSSKDMKDAGIASIAWMVIMGDGMHNFSDGLAIGAAFSAGLTGGISTSVAVFCHELPHELGDFAVLINAGMTVKQAIVYNLLSAMMAYVGMLIGTSVGQYANTVTLWIFAITAGMFLYVALVDMLPEMLHGEVENEENGFCPVGQFLLQNLGLLLGFALMLIIALYEDKIVFDFKL
ncbi:zinc transporter ZIP10 isoform X1 [Lissotriton helveticus]